MRETTIELKCDYCNVDIDIETWLYSINGSRLKDQVKYFYNYYNRCENHLCSWECCRDYSAKKAKALEDWREKNSSN